MFTRILYGRVLFAQLDSDSYEFLSHCNIRLHADWEVLMACSIFNVMFSIICIMHKVSNCSFKCHVIVSLLSGSYFSPVSVEFVYKACIVK